MPPLVAAENKLVLRQLASGTTQSTNFIRVASHGRQWRDWSVSSDRACLLGLGSGRTEGESECAYRAQMCSSTLSGQAATCWRDRVRLWQSQLQVADCTACPLPAAQLQEAASARAEAVVRKLKPLNRHPTAIGCSGGRYDCGWPSRPWRSIYCYLNQRIDAAHALSL